MTENENEPVLALAELRIEPASCVPLMANILASAKADCEAGPAAEFEFRWQIDAEQCNALITLTAKDSNEHFHFRMILGVVECGEALPELLRAAQQNPIVQLFHNLFGMPDETT